MPFQFAMGPHLLRNCTRNNVYCYTVKIKSFKSKMRIMVFGKMINMDDKITRVVDLDVCEKRNNFKTAQNCSLT